MDNVLFQVAAALLLLGGGVFCLISAIGLYRLPDVLIRMHASTKAGTLGGGMILLGVAFFYQEGAIVMRSLAAIAFLLITVPVAAHMIGRAAYVMGVPLWRGTVVDEVRGSYERMEEIEAKIEVSEPPREETGPRVYNT